MGCLFLHKWSEWTYTDRTCAQERHCLKDNCDKSETRTKHEFGDWNYIKDDCCTQFTKCSRCGEVIYRQQCPDEKHVEKDKTHCIEIHTCKRCSDQTVTSVSHQWVSNITNYKQCLQYRIDLNQAKLLRLKNGSYSYAQFNDVEKAKAIVEMDYLSKKISNDKIELLNATENLQGRICENCLFIERIRTLIRHSTVSTVTRKRIFISYCHSDKAIAKELYMQLRKQKFLPIMDDYDAKTYYSLSAYMKTIREQDYALFVISDPFLRSFNCLKEAMHFMKEKSYEERVFPLVINRDIYDAKKITIYLDYWKDELNNFKKQNVDPSLTPKLTQNMNEIQNIIVNLEDFISTIKDKKNPEIDNIVSAIVEYFNNKF